MYWHVFHDFSTETFDKYSAFFAILSQKLHFFQQSFDENSVFVFAIHFCPQEFKKDRTPSVDGKLAPMSMNVSNSVAELAMHHITSQIFP